MYVLVLLLPSELLPFLLPLRPRLTLAPVEQPALQQCVAPACKTACTYIVSELYAVQTIQKYLPDMLIVELVAMPGQRQHLALAQPHSPGRTIIRN